VGLLVQQLGVDLPERRIIVQNEDASTKGPRDEVVVAPLDRDVAERNGGRAALQLDPLLPSVVREEHAELGRGKQEVRVDVVLHHPPDEMPIG